MRKTNRLDCFSEKYWMDKQVAGSYTSPKATRPETNKHDCLKQAGLFVLPKLARIVH